MPRRILTICRVATTLAGCSGAPIDTSFTQAHQVQAETAIEMPCEQHQPAAVNQSR